MVNRHQSSVSDPRFSLPKHIGFILDGNRRWAAEKGLPTLEGHKKGYENLKEIAQACFDKGVDYVSAFIFSTENWNRSKEEVGYLMNLAVKIATKDTDELVKNNIKVLMVGSEEGVPEKVLKAFRSVEEKSKGNTGGTLALCFNYGGFQEIVDAVKSIVRSGVDEAMINKELIAQHLYNPEIPAVDLVIRTSGEQRISNFMLWRVAYAELLFVEKFWPAFSVEDLEAALLEYSRRHRRFGG